MLAESHSVERHRDNVATGCPGWLGDGDVWAAITAPLIGEPDMNPLEYMVRSERWSEVFWIRGANVIHIDGVQRDALADAGIEMRTMTNDVVFQSYVRTATGRTEGTPQ